MKKVKQMGFSTPASAEPFANIQFHVMVYLIAIDSLSLFPFRDPSTDIL